MIQTRTDGNLNWGCGGEYESCERYLGSKIYRTSQMLALRDIGFGEDWLLGLREKYKGDSQDSDLYPSE